MVRLAHLLVRLVALPPHLLGRRRLLLLLLRRTSDLSFVSTSSEKVFCCWAWLAFIDFSIFSTCAAIIFESVASLIPETMSEVSATGCEKRGSCARKEEEQESGGAGVTAGSGERAVRASAPARARAGGARARGGRGSPGDVPKASSRSVLTQLSHSRAAARAARRAPRSARAARRDTSCQSTLGRGS